MANITTIALRGALPGAACALIVLGSALPGQSQFTSTAAAPSNQFTLAHTFKPRTQTAPTIIGTAQEGRQLQADDGTWSNHPDSYDYQWKACDSSGASCSSIAGANQANYTPTSNDVGKRLRVTVTATNEGGTSDPSSSQATAQILVAAPTNTTAPALTGTAKSGQVLSVDHGAWTKSPASYAVTWQRCDTNGANCQAISGASGDTYTATDSDVGSRLRARVTATNAGGSAQADSNLSDVVVPAIPAPANTTAPVVSGSAQRTGTLTVTNGAWDPTPSGYAYKWQRCSAAGDQCADIASATAQSYTVVAGDIGFTLRAVVTASNQTGATQAASAVTAKVTDQTAPAVTITDAPSGNTPSGTVKFTVGGQTTSVKCKIDSGSASDCTSPFNVSVAQGAQHVLTVTATNAAGATSKTATWVNTSVYTSQGYWTYPGPVNWGYYEDCGGCGAYDHWYYPPAYYTDTSYWTYSGYWRID